MQMFKKLVSKMNNQRKQKAIQGMLNPLACDFDENKNEFLDKLSRQAIQMFEKKCDIKNFSKLVLSDPENTSHNDIVNGLIENGMIDPFEDVKLAHLADNKRLLRDLGLSE